MSDDTLRWRIPVGSDPQQLRVGLVQLLMASVVSTIILLVAMPPEMFAWALLPMLPLAAILALWKWRRYQRSLAGPDNVWLDARGLHWLDERDRQQTLPRAAAVGYRIASDPDTIRRVPALTLLLQDEFESQPFELHEPAATEAVREFLKQHWQLPEQRRATDDAQLAYDQALDLYSECHAENYEWHLEGPAESLAELAALVERTGLDFPLPPVAAKPRGRVLWARRGHPTHLHVQHAAVARIDHDLISGPAEFLAQLAKLLREQLPADEVAETQPKQDSRFDIAAPPRGKWTFHVHRRGV